MAAVRHQVVLQFFVTATSQSQGVKDLREVRSVMTVSG